MRSTLLPLECYFLTLNCAVQIRAENVRTEFLRSKDTLPPCPGRQAAYLWRINKIGRLAVCGAESGKMPDFPAASCR